MSRSKNTMLKTILVLALIGGSVSYLSTQTNSAKAHSALQTVEATSTTVVSGITDKTDIVRKRWQRLDMKSKVRDLQHKAEPVGQKISASLSPKITPGVKAVNWGERNMSLPAILLILIFGGVFFLMGMSGPSSRLGSRH